MTVTSFDSMLDWFGRWLAQKLRREVPGEEPFVPSDPTALRRSLRPGDVLLVAGSSKLSTAIKYLTQSTWSHAALYVGEGLAPRMEGEPHVLIEVRQDLIADKSSAHAMAARLAPVIRNALAQMGRPTIQFTRPLATNGNSKMDERTREQLEAAVFRRLVAHFRARTDVQNIDLMTLAGFCRNCLGDWYRDAAAEKGIAIDKDAARELVYGMPQSEWKKRHQKESTPEQQAAFERSQKTHS